MRRILVVIVSAVFACGDDSGSTMPDAAADTRVGSPDARRDTPDARMADARDDDARMADASMGDDDAGPEPTDAGADPMDALPDPMDGSPDPDVGPEPIDAGPDLSVPPDVIPTGLEVRCASTLLPAGSDPVACQAILVVTIDGAVAEIDVSTAAETTWSLGACTGTTACGTEDAPSLETSGARAGLFTPAGRTCAATVSSDVVQIVLARWQRDATTLDAMTEMTTSPAFALGYEMEPHNATVPLLADPACASGGGTAGLVVRYWMFASYAGGGRCMVPMTGGRVVGPPVGTPVARFVRVTPEGALDVELTADPGRRTPTRHDIVGVLAGADTAMTSLVVAPLVETVMRVDPPSAPVTSARRAYLDLPGGVVFEITRLGNPTHLERPPRSRPDPASEPRMTWSCSGATSPSAFSHLWPWTEAGCPRAMGDLDGPYRCTSATAIPATTAAIELTGAGTFGVVPSSGTPGSHTMELSFPYVGAPGALRASFGISIPAIAIP